MIIDIARYTLMCFDADGTLRRCTVSGQPCPNAPNEWELMPNVVDTLAQLPASTIIGICSNQAGVAAGYLSYRAAERLLETLYIEVTARRPKHRQRKTAYPGTIQLCPHAPEEGCICRKPYPAMICDVMRGACVHQRAQVLYVGDLETDRECAERAGVDFMWAKDFFRWED